MHALSSRMARLPKWAQRYIQSYEQALAEKEGQIAQLRIAHSVLYEYDGWFTIKGPPSECANKDGNYHLFFLGHTGAHTACVLGPNDIMLCGRRSTEKQPKS